MRMGRLFWKFFAVVWLAQATGVIVTSVYISIHRDLPPAALGEFRPPPPAQNHRPPLAGRHPGPPLPVLHILAGLLGSLLSAAGIAWYVARPVGRLKDAFQSASEGDLTVRIGPAMGRRRDELSDLAHDFDRMTSQLQSLMEAQTRLLHDVSHELRSPLARLHAAIGLARQDPARFEETMSRIEREGERMNVLVGELLTLSRLEAGVVGHSEVFDLDELLAERVDDARFEAESRRIRVRFDAENGLQVRAVPELLHRAIENVLRNALRYSPDEGELRVAIHALPNQRCRISVQDQGPGVPESELEHIFEAFRRHAARGEGYGLGLAIARRVMHTVDGSIQAKNRPEGGLQVDLELPLFNG